jgi:hypothetical protein
MLVRCGAIGLPTSGHIPGLPAGRSTDSSSRSRGRRRLTGMGPDQRCGRPGPHTAHRSLAAPSRRSSGFVHTDASAAASHRGEGRYAMAPFCGRPDPSLRCHHSRTRARCAARPSAGRGPRSLGAVLTTAAVGIIVNTTSTRPRDRVHTSLEGLWAAEAPTLAAGYPGPPGFELIAVQDPERLPPTRSDKRRCDRCRSGPSADAFTYVLAAPCPRLHRHETTEHQIDGLQRGATCPSKIERRKLVCPAPGLPSSSRRRHCSVGCWSLAPE